jgi:hypothetical protein
MEEVIEYNHDAQIYLKEKMSMKRHRQTVVISIITLSIVLAFGVMALSITSQTHASNVASKNGKVLSTINDLTHISVVGSTAFIVDAHGRTIAVDANPYGVAIVPATVHASKAAHTLQPGDIIVTNIGGNDTGTTLVRFPHQKGPGLLFNTVTNRGTKGPADEAIDSMTGADWVANVSGNNVQIFGTNGAVLKTITNPLFNKPWGMAFNHGTHNSHDKSVGAFFTSNVADATIDRIAVVPGKSGPTFKVYRIGQLTKNGKETKIGLIWVPSLQVHGHKLIDVLLAIDPAMNRIAAFPNSSTINTSTSKGTGKGITVFQGKPLNNPGGFTLNPLNGDLLVVNLNDNNLVELNITTGHVVGVRLLDNVPVDLQTGNGSALFGVAATKDAQGNLEVFFTDDNMNTLNVFSK